MTVHFVPADRRVHDTCRRDRAPFVWWLPGLVVGLLASGLFVWAVTEHPEPAVADRAGAAWWIVTGATHLPFLLILAFLIAGIAERIGYFARGRAPASPGRLPRTWPTVCVQLPMFNEHAVARRVIEAACAMSWPAHRLSVQVLDDSTDDDTRALVDEVCAEVRALTGVDCFALRRPDRRGYKAGALEVGRHRTGAEFLAILDADFVPPRDFLTRTISHFYTASADVISDLALVQAQWGHLNHDESALTRAQSLWVDDHHTLQMSWRSAKWDFVNFTGTAGVWRASAVEAAGGWRAASLVEDCELSFRHLFAGYRTTFVKEIVVPAELPATYTAYKAQQRRWTQGWVQLQRLHLGTLLRRFPSPWPRRMHLLYHMCISWQWPSWGLWIMILPFLIQTGHWFGAFGLGGALAVYLGPSISWLLITTTLASVETRHTYSEPLSPRVLLRRCRRVIPYVVINTGMLPHQCFAFIEGLFGPLHSEFERTPKAATITPAAAAASGRSAGPAAGQATPVPARRSYAVTVHWPYVLAEAFFVAYQLAWATLFAIQGFVIGAVGSAAIAGCVAWLGVFYGDHLGKVFFVVDRPRPAATRGVRPESVVDRRRQSATGPPARPTMMTSVTPVPEAQR